MCLFVLCAVPLKAFRFLVAFVILDREVDGDGDEEDDVDGVGDRRG